MNFFEEEFKLDLQDEASSQIHYYTHLPKHIKEGVGELNDLKPDYMLPNNNSTSPAHVVNGTVTVVNGRLNIPAMNLTSHENFYF